MKSLDPVILTWVKADPKKKLSEVPTLTVQSFPLSEKLRSFFQKYNSRGGCFDLQDKEWKQSWCEMKNQAYVILSKNETPELIEHKKRLMTWVRND